jgi:hypothetical protein
MGHSSTRRHARAPIQKLDGPSTPERMSATIISVMCILVPPLKPVRTHHAKPPSLGFIRDPRVSTRPNTFTPLFSVQCCPFGSSFLSIWELVSSQSVPLLDINSRSNLRSLLRDVTSNSLRRPFACARRCSPESESKSDAKRVRKYGLETLFKISTFATSRNFRHFSAAVGTRNGIPEHSPSRKIFSWWMLHRAGTNVPSSVLQR